MKTFLAATVIAILAIVLLENSLINANEGGRRCKEGEKPPLNTTEVTCDENGQPGAVRKCISQCNKCYERSDLVRPGGCLVVGNCTCLGKASEGGSTTTVATVTPETTTEPVAPMVG